MTALLVVLLLSPWATAEVSAAGVTADPTEAGARLPAAGPWTSIEALWQRILGSPSRAPSAATGGVAVSGGGTGGDVGQGLDPDGGTGDPAGEEEPPPPPPGEGSTSGGGDGGSL